MRIFNFSTILLFIVCSACQLKQDDSKGTFSVYCEMVASDSKPIALSEPMTRAVLNVKWDRFKKIAEGYDVEIYRESDLPVTPLFPAIENKEVVVIYRDARLIQYRQWKGDLSKISPEAGARRLGRLLGYTPQGVNELLMKNSEFRTLESFGVRQQVTHLYYMDLNEAKKFYGEILGLNAIGEDVFAISKDALLHLHVFDEMHPAGQQQSTAIALLTDQLPEWYAYVQERGVPIKYTYKPREGGPHDGFVAIDPGGYLLEFEEFKQDAENELFLAEMEYSPRVFTQVDSLNFFGSITWTYHKDMLKMQRFYEEVLGFRMVADQGWTKIYQTSSAGFIGLVDECRGMMDYAEEKAVEVEWQLSNLEVAIDYFSKNDFWNTEGELLIGPERYRYLLH